MPWLQSKFLSLFSFLVSPSSSPSRRNLFIFVLTWNYGGGLFKERYRTENIYSHCLYRLCFNHFAPRHFQEQHPPSSTTHFFFFFCLLFFLKVQGSIPHSLHKHKPRWRQWEFFRGEGPAPWPAAVNTLGLSLLMDGIWILWWALFNRHVCQSPQTSWGHRRQIVFLSEQREGRREVLSYRRRFLPSTRCSLIPSSLLLGDQ